MNKLYLGLAAASLLVLLGTAVFQPAPGYMDAQYYYAGALQLYRGEGFQEMLLWHYLDDPAGLPHASHGYWMPLVSILAAWGMKLGGGESFAYSRLLLGAMAVCIAPLTAALSYRIHKRRGFALLSGLLAVFCGFYLPFISLTDSFAVVMLLGLAYFSILAGTEQNPLPTRLAWSALLLGVVAGLMHLARADGFLWLFFALGYISLSWQSQTGERLRGFRLAALVICLAGYLAIMGPWFWRNLQDFGSLSAPGNLRTLWLLEYNELYVYPFQHPILAKMVAGRVG